MIILHHFILTKHLTDIRINVVSIRCLVLQIHKRFVSPLRRFWTAPSPGFAAWPPSHYCRLLRRRRMKRMKGWMKL